MAWLTSHHKVATPEEAVMLGNDMQRAGLLHHVSFKRPFQDKESLYRCCLLHALHQTSLCAKHGLCRLLGACAEIDGPP